MLSSLQLQALVALCDIGSFDTAAKSLHISTSALSQRITALEKAVGFPLISRGRPVTPTPEGERILGLARATVLLHTETLAALEGGDTPTDMPRVNLAINADSLATWFRPIVAQVAKERRWRLELTIDDEAHTADLLAGGRVTCAISTAAHTSAGARVEPLGVMRYRAVAAPVLYERWDTDDPRELPFIRFNSRDLFQHRFLDALGAPTVPPFHTVPSHLDFTPAIEAGLGWAMLPEEQARERVGAGALEYVRAGGRRKTAPPVDVTLYWHRQRMQSGTLDLVSEMVRKAARRALRRA